MNSSELKTRTKEFALRVMRLVGALPKDSVGRAIGNQLIRSGTSLLDEANQITAIMVVSRKTAKKKQ